MKNQGYLAVPPSGSGPGVLVLHAWWGLNDTIKAFCDKLAENGFTVFAPDLYHGKVADTIPDAEVLGKALDANFVQAKAEVLDAANYLDELTGHDKKGIAVIGFSLGAYYAVDLSNSDPKLIRSVVLFYGTGDNIANSKADYLAHFAENDEYEPRIYADNFEKALKEAGRPATFYFYPGTKHWFFEPDRKEEYNEEAAKLAWDRTLSFLKR